MSIEEENKEFVRRVIEGAFNKGDLSVADDGVAENYFFHGPVGEFKGRENFKQLVTSSRTAFPDFHITIEDMVGEGNKLACRFILRGTFKGEWMGVAPTGKEIAIAEASFIYFEDGKEVEVCSYMDLLGWYQQLGISPPNQ